MSAAVLTPSVWLPTCYHSVQHCMNKQINESTVMQSTKKLDVSESPLNVYLSSACVYSLL